MHWWTTPEDLLNACYAEDVRDVTMINMHENRRNGQSMVSSLSPVERQPLSARMHVSIFSGCLALCLVCQCHCRLQSASSTARSLWVWFRAMRWSFVIPSNRRDSLSTRWPNARSTRWTQRAACLLRNTPRTARLPPLVTAATILRNT